MLCEVCVDLGHRIDELFVPDGIGYIEKVEVDGVKLLKRPHARGYRHHESISSMVEAANAGCELCRLVVEETRNALEGSMTALDLEKRVIYARILDHRDDKPNQGTTTVIFYQSHPDDAADIQALSTILGVYAHSDDPASTTSFVRGELVKAELSSSAYSKAKKWIEDCIGSHPRCRNSPDLFPPRVIDVGPADGTREPRLVINETLREPWVALSHCWGGGISSATLQSNLHPRTEALPMSDLPANFRDAITITRELGYQYLWVDAICIIQDSQSDWRGHLPLMGDIYQFAVVTISADVAKDSYTGIILRRQRAATSVSIPYRSVTRGIEGVVSFRPLLRVSPRGPILKRGWTLQEDLLSVRSLYFSVDQLLWQCQTTRSSEGDSDPPSRPGHYHTGIPSSLKQSFLLPVGQSIGNTATDPSSPLYHNSTPSGEALDHWYLIVNEYVKRILTVEQDRFPALSGIARQIEKRTGYQYIAGLWKEDIHVGLLWSTNGTGKKRGDIESPSWSWAGVHFPGLGRSNVPYGIWSGARSLTKRSISALVHSKALINEIRLDTCNSDIYGGIKSGTLNIEGNFQKVTDWRFLHQRPLLYKQGQRFDLSDLIRRRTYAEPITDSPHILCELDYHEHWPDKWTAENRECFEAGIAFLQIYRLSGPERGDPSGRELVYKYLGIAYALILESVGNEGKYRRRGIAEIPCEEGMADVGWDIRPVNIV